VKDQAPISHLRKRLRVEIHGAVQGVGFRPYVYRLATELALAGWVINDTRGVFIEVEGDEAALARFLERLPNDKPPRAIIHTLDVAWIEPLGETRFEIRHSDEAGAKTVLVLPDIATCDDCLREVFDVRDRRARYPFTNCTNCGPRFSIIEALPYDRPNTTMRHFTMCPDCQREYDDPRNRRFHAQPNACPVCGPKLKVQSSKFKVSSKLKVENLEPQTSNLEPIAHTARLISQGYIVAVKGLGGFLLMADARNAETLARLRERKPRRDKPFALMARDLTQSRTLVEMDAQAEALLTSPEAPIVLLRRKPDAPVAENVAPGNPYLGVMLPYTPLHHLLLRELDFPVVATSGNLSDEPICTDENEALERLGHIADFFLIHNRPIARHVDDSVMTIMLGEPRFLRRARGYAPLPILLARDIPTILAVGAHLKNTIALSVRNQVFISQHIGDLETPEAMNAFERVIADFLRLYEATPVAIAHDLHPDYLSTKWAREQLSGSKFQVASSQLETSNLKLETVQHHHAHLAACLAENHAARALGVTWDGTGYGTDGTIWGGEFLLGDAKDFVRVAHLRPFRLPGGEVAVKEPRRVALALLWELYGDTALERDDLAPIRAFTRAERRTLAQMLARGINAPVTTSAGRLFDGVAALIGLHQCVSFEGQAAMALEYAADEAVMDAYPIETKDERRMTNDSSSVVRRSSFVLRPSSFVLDWRPLIEAVLGDLSRGVESSIIAARFHNALVEAIVAVAREIGEENVALSGGCFQNRWLTERAATRLAQAGFRVLLHRHVPPNDGCVSLGQVVVAAARNL